MSNYLSPPHYPHRNPRFHTIPKFHFKFDNKNNQRPFKQFLASTPCCHYTEHQKPTKNPSNSTNLHNLPHTNP